MKNDGSSVASARRMYPDATPARLEYDTRKRGIHTPIATAVVAASPDTNSAGGQQSVGDDDS